MLKAMVLSIGAVITVGAHAITGYRVHLWMRRHAPGLAAWIPRDGGAIVGALAGIGLICWWLRG